MQRTIITTPNGSKVSGKSKVSAIEGYNSMTQNRIVTPTDLRFMLMSAKGGSCDMPLRYRGKVKTTMLYHCIHDGTFAAELKTSRIEILLTCGRTITIERDLNLNRIIEIVGDRINEVRFIDAKAGKVKMHVKLTFI